MNRKLIILFLLTFSSSLFAQNERSLVEIPLNDYIVGTSYNYPEQIQRAFIDSATLYLTRNGGTWITDPKTYADLFQRNEAGTFNGRTSKILSIEIRQDIAMAEIEVSISSAEARFSDLILLKKVEGQWKIMSKIATRYKNTRYNRPQQKVIIDGLKTNWSMDFINEKEVLLAEKDGNLLRIDLSTQKKSIIQGFPSDLFQPIKLDLSKYPAGTYPKDADGKVLRYNAGILEILLDPNFSENNWIYVSYISQKSDTYALKVIRARLVGNEMKEIKTLLNPGPYVAGLFHFGGGMTFGQDGKLYITAGERLFFENLKKGLPIAQDVTDARGKIYRINSDGSIPKDNPDFGPKAIKGIYSLGIRAAQGITLNPVTGKIWFSEHGTIQGDEINLLEAGANYGWPNVTTGSYRSKDYQPASLPNPVYTDPIHYWLQTVAPTGLVFYNGNAFPKWKGNLIVPGLSRGSLWRISLEGKKVKQVEELFTDKHVRLRKAEMSPDGKLYILTSEENGKIIEIVASDS
ncbi:MAG: PQQ-dependent sugar dehydrogenase [Bacteroidota bacterium]